jgi:hypothetical protein
MLNKKELEKVAVSNIKREVKKKGFKTISNCIYKRIDNYFCYSVFWLQYNEDTWFLSLRMNIKPYNYDELFLKILNTSKDLTIRDSLRANGAYACPPIQLGEKLYEISNLEKMELDIEKAINSFEAEIENFNIKVKEKFKDFDNFILAQEEILDNKLLKMIANISLENYAIAREMATTEIRNNKRGGYSNEGKDIYQHIVEYCKSKL